MNDLNPSMEFWQDQYEAETTGWDRGEVHPALVEWIAGGDLSPCQIVVPGCGRGHEVIHLSRNGFAVTAIDYAPAPIEFLQSRLETQGLNATLVHGDMFDFDASAQFDAVYEQTCLCAIEPQLRTGYAKRVYDWLRPGGKLFLLLMQTESASDSPCGKESPSSERPTSAEGPPFHCDPEAMRKLFSDDRWKWQSADSKKYVHPSGQIYELANILSKK